MVIDLSVKKRYVAIAVCDEDVLEMYMNRKKFQMKPLLMRLYKKKAFLLARYFGSALKNEGIDKLLMELICIFFEPVYQRTGAKVFKIVKENECKINLYENNRLRHKSMIYLVELQMKIQWSEKINDIRVYSGEKFKSISEADAGCICAISGLNNTYPGQGLGFEMQSESPNLQPVLSY